MASPWPGRARSTGRCGSPATPCCMTASARSPTAPGRHRPAPSRMRALPGHRAGALQHDRSGGRRAVRAGPPRAPSPSTTKAGAISAKTDPLSRVSSRRRQPTSAAASAGHPSARGLKSPGDQEPAGAFSAGVHAVLRHASQADSANGAADVAAYYRPLAPCRARLRRHRSLDPTHEEFP